MPAAYGGHVARVQVQFAGAVGGHHGPWRACKPRQRSGCPETRRSPQKRSPGGSVSCPAAHSRPATGSAAAHRRPGSSAWLLSSGSGIEDGTELAEHLHRLLDDLEPVTARLRDLVHAGYKAGWFCYIASHATEHAAGPDRQTLQRLLALPGDLWLDVCGETGHDELAERTHIGQV